MQPKSKAEWLYHLNLREGFRSKVYLDSLGKPTAGIGHLLNPDERMRFPVGTEVPKQVLQRWLEKDSATALKAATTQAELLGLPPDHPFLFALASVCFQLGPLWFTIHKKTWSALREKRYVDALKEVEKSLWFKQTPVRVKDFQEAIRNLLKESLNNE